MSITLILYYLTCMYKLFYLLVWLIVTVSYALFRLCIVILVFVGRLFCPFYTAPVVDGSLQKSAVNHRHSNSMDIIIYSGKKVTNQYTEILKIYGTYIAPREKEK